MRNIEKISKNVNILNMNETILDENTFKSKIKDGYEKNNYLIEFRKRELLPFEKSVFDKVIDLIPKKAKILDLGCGSGYPYDNFFCKLNYDLTGVDFSTKHIKEAKNNNPNAKYLVEDIEKYNYNSNYDLVMMLFSLLHLPRKHHKDILEAAYNHLNKNGILLLTLRDEDAGDLKYKEDFCGDEMLWSYYDYNTYISIIKEIGFEIIYSENQNKHGISESHNWLILKK